LYPTKCKKEHRKDIPKYISTSVITNIVPYTAEKNSNTKQKPKVYERKMLKLIRGLTLIFQPSFHSSQPSSVGFRLDPKLIQGLNLGSQFNLH
jgi:hypothetical protein